MGILYNLDNLIKMLKKQNGGVVDMLLAKLTSGQMIKSAFEILGFISSTGEKYVMTSLSVQ